MTLPKEQGGLGFRDLHSFNIAMLARQVWRLIQKPESLCVRVLQAKYFPHDDVLKAEALPGMSYVWRSLLQGLLPCARRDNGIINSYFANIHMNKCLGECLVHDFKYSILCLHFHVILLLLTKKLWLHMKHIFINYVSMASIVHFVTLMTCLLDSIWWQ